MSKFTIYESDQFLRDVEEAAIWILVTNLEQSESLAEKKVNEFNFELKALKNRLTQFPESGEEDTIKGIRKFPIYGGRYSVKWIMSDNEKRVTLITLADSKYPKKLRNFGMD